MKTKITTLYTLVLKSLLVLLGFSGCTSDNGDEKVMYGVPTTQYKVRGVALDEATRQPVENVRAILYMDEESIKWESDTVYTDAAGKFDLKLHWEGARKLNVAFKDLDEERDITYEEKTVEVDLKDADKKDKWLFEKNMSQVYLTPTEESEDEITGLPDDTDDTEINR